MEQGEHYTHCLVLVYQVKGTLLAPHTSTGVGCVYLFQGIPEPLRR